MDSQTFSKEYIIQNKLGLHARPAALFVQTASQFTSSILVIKNEQEQADGKSLLSLLVLAITAGTRVRISAEGTDARHAVETLGALIDRRFDEE